jgi:hypothetical protein
MLLPFKLPHAGLQAWRKRLFYWRVVYYYRCGERRAPRTRCLRPADNDGRVAALPCAEHNANVSAAAPFVLSLQVRTPE